MRHCHGSAGTSLPVSIISGPHKTTGKITSRDRRRIIFISLGCTVAPFGCQAQNERKRVHQTAMERVFQRSNYFRKKALQRCEERNDAQPKRFLRVCHDCRAGAPFRETLQPGEHPMKIRILVLLTAVSLISRHALPADDSFVGKWKLNPRRVSSAA